MRDVKPLKITTIRSIMQGIVGFTVQSEQITVCVYHHGMARPLVAGGGDGLQMWKVAGIY
jgi:hypothetical protein